MKKATHIVNITSETILSLVLVSIIAFSFFATSNLSSIKSEEKKSPDVLGAFKYTKTFNPNYITSEFINVKDGNLDSGGANLNVDIQSRTNEETVKTMTIYNNEKFKMNLNVVVDFVKLDKNSNYYLIVNDKEQLIKDSYKDEQKNLLIELESEKEASVSVRVKSMERIDTNFNIIFSEY